MKENADYTKNPDQTLEKIKSELEKSAAKRKEELEQEYQAKLKQEEEEQKSKLEKINQEYEENKTALESFQKIFTEFNTLRSDLTKQLKQHTEKAEKLGTKIKSDTQQMLEELKNAFDLKQKAKNILQEKVTTLASENQKLREKFDFSVEFPTEIESENQNFDINHELSRVEKINELLERVGLNERATHLIRSYSRGMVQRLGLAQALINDPSILILDEPMASLDPVGRKDFRDLILELKAQGKTIFFSSHILSDAEKICDRVCFISRGKLVSLGTLDGMLNREVLSTEIECSQEKVDFNIIEDSFNKFEIVKSDIKFRLILPQDVNLNIVLKRLIELGVQIESVLPSKETLEDVFIKKMNI